MGQRRLPDMTMPGHAETCPVIVAFMRNRIPVYLDALYFLEVCVNNAVIIFNEKFAFLEGLPAGGEIAIYVVSAVCLLASLAYLIFIDKRGNRKREGEIKPFSYAALAGILLCALFWVINLVSGIGG